MKMYKQEHPNIDAFNRLIVVRNGNSVYIINKQL